MNKRLFFICPTDYLETVINTSFNSENYFVTSLGNSIEFNLEMVEEINALIEMKRIKEITFILSDDNRIIKDAIEKRDFSRINRLSDLYSNIHHQKIQSKWMWQSNKLNPSILSNHLNTKMEELQPKLSTWLLDSVKLDIKIYHRRKGIFNEIHYDLFNHEICLN